MSPRGFLDDVLLMSVFVQYWICQKVQTLSAQAHIAIVFLVEKSSLLLTRGSHSPPHLTENDC